jgi:hypothetical protein
MAEVPPPPPSEDSSCSDVAPRPVDINEVVYRRAIIEQAKGVLMHTYDVDADQAFEMIRARASQARLKVRTLAARIVHDPQLARNLWG